MARLRDALPRKCFVYCHRENSEVETERAVIDVPDVVLELFFPGQRVSAVNLRPTRDPWTRVMPTRLLGRVALEILHQQWPRPDHAHLAAQDVQEFGQFVEACGAQPSS